jgi:hypothetical protein
MAGYGGKARFAQCWDIHRKRTIATFLSELQLYMLTRMKA